MNVPQAHKEMIRFYAQLCHLADCDPEQVLTSASFLNYKKGYQDLCLRALTETKR